MADDSSISFNNFDVDGCNIFVLAKVCFES
jgi:hypothetical protein